MRTRYREDVSENAELAECCLIVDITVCPVATRKANRCIGVHIGKKSGVKYEGFNPFSIV